MTYQIKNTINGKMVKDAVSRKPLQFHSEQDALKFAASHQANIIMADAHRLNTTPKFQFKVMLA